MHQSLEISGCWQANCVRDVSATALSCHFEQWTCLIRIPPWPLHADMMLLPVKVDVDYLYLDKVNQHQSEAWPYGHQRRCHNPAKKNLLRLLCLAFLARCATGTLLTTVCSHRVHYLSCLTNKSFVFGSHRGSLDHELRFTYCATNFHSLKFVRRLNSGPGHWDTGRRVAWTVVPQCLCDPFSGVAWIKVASWHLQQLCHSVRFCVC